MEDRFEEAVEIADLVAQLGQVRRATRHPDGEKESDTTHSMMLALVALHLAPVECGDLSIAKVLTFALVHDLPEALVGDVVTLRPLSSEESRQKAEKEDKAIETILTLSPALGAHIEAYERQDTPEARFVRVLDKAMPKILHTWDGGRVPKEHGVTAEELDRLQRSQGKHLAGEASDLVVAHDFFDWISERSLESYLEDEE